MLVNIMAADGLLLKHQDISNHNIDSIPVHNHSPCLYKTDVDVCIFPAAIIRTHRCASCRPDTSQCTPMSLPLPNAYYGRGNSFYPLFFFFFFFFGGGGGGRGDMAIKIHLHFLHFLNKQPDDTGSQNPFFMGEKNLFIMHIQYHRCRWHGTARCQGISSYGMFLVILA